MAEIPKVIGEGAYGCVHKPSLLCKNQTARKPNTISKLMSTMDADVEMREYELIKRADPNLKYYLGKPKQCAPDEGQETIAAIEECRIKDSVLRSFHKYSLLLMPDGGTDLSALAKKYNELEATPHNRAEVELFFIEAQRILLGLNILLENGIIHHDMKQHNLVYNEETRRINFIDFGLMSTKPAIVAQLSRSVYPYSSKFHWSFPFEFKYLNKNMYDKFAKNDLAKKSEIVKKMIKRASALKTDDFSVAMSFFTSTVIGKNFTVEKREQYLKALLTEFSETMLSQMQPENYRNVVNKSLDTFDSYGVAIALTYVLKNCTKFLEDGFVRELTDMFRQAISPNLELRLDPYNLLLRYENALNTHGILEKHRKHFDEHVLKNGQPLSPAIERAIDAIDVADVILPPSEVRHTSPPVKQCPEGKELNPKSKRCIYTCALGYARDADFKCKRVAKDRRVTAKKQSSVHPRVIAPPPSPLKLKLKLCPEGKELNPNSNRCIYTCRLGYSRDADFKCKKNKSSKRR